MAVQLSGRALWWESAGHARLRPVSAGNGAGVVVRARFGLVSAGTERLVGSGRVPREAWEHMRAPLMEGSFSFPVKYGYSVAGEREADDRAVFSLHPHQERFEAPAAMVWEIPETVPLGRAPLYPILETALNAVWDAGLRPGQRVAVVGCGIVGAAVAWLCARTPGVELTVVEASQERRELLASRSEALGFGRGCLASAEDLARDSFDVVFHCTGAPETLRSALRACAPEGRVVELSWYGDRSVELGADFHWGRKRLVSSQVGRVSPGAGPGWTPERRRAAVFRLLADASLDSLFTHEIPFEKLPAFLEGLVRGETPGLAIRVRYQEETCTPSP